ncbi:MAG: hypothetical protein RL660_484 [Bacteroidota bacterium]|jgi:hypothetical protein
MKIIQEMKKLLFVLSLVCITYFAQAQQAAPEYVYCELTEVPRPFSTKVNIVVDYGQAMKWFADNRLRDEESGEIKKFNSMIEALNYMNGQGWEFVQALIVPTGTSTTSGGGWNGNRLYILKRKLTDSEKAEWQKNSNK